MNRTNRIKTLLALTASFLAAVSVRADVTLNAIFDEHMVLQRGIPVAVYGTAEPGEKVTVAFTGQTQTATADNKGAWCVTLAAMKVSTEAAMMTVTGKNKLTLNDVVGGMSGFAAASPTWISRPAPTTAPRNNASPCQKSDGRFHFPARWKNHIFIETPTTTQPHQQHEHKPSRILAANPGHRSPCRDESRAFVRFVASFASRRG